jgi:hypothetical protein
MKKRKATHRCTHKRTDAQTHRRTNAQTHKRTEALVPLPNRIITPLPTQELSQPRLPIDALLGYEFVCHASHQQPLAVLDLLSYGRHLGFAVQEGERLLV